jgi:hypothetical protein
MSIGLTNMKLNLKKGLVRLAIVLSVIDILVSVIRLFQPLFLTEDYRSWWFTDRLLGYFILGALETETALSVYDAVNDSGISAVIWPLATIGVIWLCVALALSSTIVIRYTLIPIGRWIVSGFRT